jgi:acetylglutamate kinase
MMPSDIVLVKLGGKAAENEARIGEMCEELCALSRSHSPVLVHGGGAEVTAVSKRFGIDAVFRDGIRQTSSAEMDIVDMVLAGKMNKKLVRMLRARGLDAVGLSGSDGGIFTGRALGEETRTGEISKIDPRLIVLLIQNGFLPVISSSSMDGAGRGLNINADNVAFGLASRLAASALVFLSDIPGIMRGGTIIPRLSSAEADTLMADGVISGGMIPKVKASEEALEAGVGSVIIGQYEEPGSLARLLEGSLGTRITA